MEYWSGAEWAADGPYWFGQYGGGASPRLEGPPLAVTVLRNGPECVTIRLAYDAASIVTNARFAVNVDVSLRRGSNFAEIYLETRGAYRWLVKTPIPYATAVSSTSGVVADPATGAAFAWGNSESVEFSDPRAFCLTAANPDPTFLLCGIGHITGTVNVAACLKAAQRYASAQSERVLAVAR